ncbi:MAG TPA: aminoacetone oxidase family FAD-binding enzyme, partial [Nitratifractor sp.]|nr:aminoacetone oxidase family FAD-binding enzyme [Nitratifractor sp.]
MAKDAKQKEYENIIIGAGASGLMFAAHIINKKETLLIEGNSKIGAKIEISGGGRCNFTNKRIDISDYLADKFFIEETLRQYSNSWLIEWFKSRGLEYTLKNG